MRRTGSIQEMVIIIRFNISLNLFKIGFPKYDKKIQTNEKFLIKPKSNLIK